MVLLEIGTAVDALRGAELNAADAEAQGGQELDLAVEDRLGPGDPPVARLHGGLRRLLKTSLKDVFKRRL